MDRDRGVKTIEFHGAQHPVARQRCQRVEVHVQPVPAQERRGAVFFPDVEVLHRDRQGIRVQAQLADCDRAAELRGEPFLGLCLDDGRQD